MKYFLGIRVSFDSLAIFHTDTCRCLERIYELNIYFWSTEPQRESDSEGQVEEGVRVALLKLVTDGSRPIGEMSDS